MSERRLIFIVAEGCPTCELMKSRLGDKVEVLDVTKSLEAARIVRDLGVYKVPLLVTVEGEHICMLDEETMKVKCVKTTEATNPTF